MYILGWHVWCVLVLRWPVPLISIGMHFQKSHSKKPTNDDANRNKHTQTHEKCERNKTEIQIEKVIWSKGKSARYSWLGSRNPKHLQPTMLYHSYCMFVATIAPILHRQHMLYNFVNSERVIFGICRFFHSCIHWECEQVNSASNWETERARKTPPDVIHTHTMSIVLVYELESAIGTQWRKLLGISIELSFESSLASWLGLNFKLDGTQMFTY